MKKRWVPQYCFSGYGYCDRLPLTFLLRKFQNQKSLTLADVPVVVDNPVALLSSLVREQILATKDDVTFTKGSLFDHFMNVLAKSHNLPDLKVYVADRGVYGMGFALATSKDQASEIINLNTEGATWFELPLAPGVSRSNTGDE